MKYYELTKDIFGPGIPNAHRGWRKTKEEWIAMYPSLGDHDFGPYIGMFYEREDKDPEVDVCVDILSELMEVPHSSSRNSLSELLNKLKAMELEATDVAKAYGLRIAGDVVNEYLDQKQDPTRETLANMVRIKWAYMNKCEHSYP